MKYKFNKPLASRLVLVKTHLGRLFCNPEISIAGLILCPSFQSSLEYALVALIVTSRDIHIGFILLRLGFNQE